MISKTTPVIEGITPQRFRSEVMPSNRPVVLRGLVRDWPIVQHALQSPESVAAYLKRLDAGMEAEAMISPPEERGNFTYKPDLSSFNFRKFRQKVGFSLDWLIAHKHMRPQDQTCEAAAMQAMPADQYFPGFMAEHPMPLLGEGAVPRFWIGNAARVQTHYDIMYNIACNVSGQRTFTLFPPDQLKNLYPGPFDFTPAGTPISMVDVEDPDYDRYPLYTQAEAVAEVAVLQPGDALYVPYFWWHNVRSEGPLNILVNYWWNEARDDGMSAYHAFYTALVSLRHMPDDQRDAWRNVFDHYIFRRHGDPLAHLPVRNHGILGEQSAGGMLRLKAFVLDMMRQTAAEFNAFMDARK